MSKHVTQFLLVLAFLASSVVGMAQKSVLSEDFEGASIPAAWTTAGNYWKFQNSEALFEALVENGMDTLYTPLISLSQLDNHPSVALRYRNVANGNKVNTLVVMCRGEVSDGWDTLQIFNEEAAEGTYFKKALPDTLTQVQLAFVGLYEQGVATAIDWVSVENKSEATEAPTGLKYEDLTTNSVVLWWDACTSDKFVQYNVKVSTTQLTNPDAQTGDVVDNVGWEITDEFYELTNLTPNTHYWLYVQYDCGDGDLSPWAEFQFTTPCVAIQAPYTEDFENGLSGCYTIIRDGSATTADVSAEYAYNSNKAFKVNIEGTAGFWNYLILPELEGNIQDYQISFMAASIQGGNTYARSITVGVCSDASDKSTFTEITTLDLPKGRVWENIVVSFKGYAGDGKYIALKIGHASMKTNIFIDDIKVEAASACPKPMFVQALSVTSNGATLSWTKTGSESEWNIVLSTQPLNNPEAIEPDAAKGEFAGSVSTNPYTFSGLQPNTTYYAYVQAGCGASEWTEAVSFKTAKEVAYPYTERFDRMESDLYTNTVDAIPDGWVMDVRGNNAAYASYYDKQYTSTTYHPYVTTVQNHEATAYVKASLLLRGTAISSTSTTSTGYTSIAILPAMPKDVNVMMVTFWAYATAAQTVVVGVANTQTNDLPQGQQLGANITEVGSVAITTGEWKQYKVLLTNYEGIGRYIALYLKPGTSTPAVYIDDIVIDDAPDCNAVATVTAEATGVDKATVTWEDASSSTSWVIKVSTTEIDPESADGDIVAAQTVTEKNYNLTGLTMGATYYVYVSPTCGDMWKSTSVTTLVGLQVPYYNDFTDETTGANANRGPKNWTLGFTYTDTPAATSTYWPYINTTAWTSAPADVVKNSLYLYNGTSASYRWPYAIMPELLNADVKDVKLIFYLYTTLTANLGTADDPYYNELKIGVVDSPSDINKTDGLNNITPVATVRAKASKTPQQEVVDMSSYTGTGKYIVFYQDQAKADHSYIDNLYILDKNDPLPPAAVADVAAADITKTGATVTWTEKGEATQWNVRVFTALQDDPAAGEPVFTATVNTTPSADITGLSASTQYYVYVQSVQSNGNGAWVSASLFTECDAYAVPFTEDWESYSTGANTLLPCFIQTAGAQVAASSAPNASVKTGQVFKFNATSTNKEPMLVFPTFDKPVNKLQLTMAASPYSSSYVGDASYTEIGVLEDDETFVKVAEYRFNLSDVKAWDECFVNFGSYTGEGGRIAIRSPYLNSKTTHICFDNVVIEEIPLCSRIATIDVTEIDSISATISWAKGKTENKWNLKVSTTELEDMSATADIFDGVMTEQTKALTDLDGNTTYYVYVQSVDETLECTGAWSNAKSFTTLCQKQNFPYSEDFESYATGSGNVPDCSIQCGDDAEPSYVTTKGTGNKALWLRQVTKDHNNYFVFPALAVDSVKRLQLSMQVYVGTTATYTYPFEVGVMTDPNDPSTFVSTHSEALAGQSAAYDRKYTFEGYAGDETGEHFGTFIAIKPLNYKNASGTEYVNNSIYIDNVTIDFIETCFKPTDISSKVGTDTVCLAWMSENAESATYLVRLFKDADADPNTTTPVAEAIAEDTTVVFRDLTGNTTYYAYVRTICAETDQSLWSSVYSFKTECPAVIALPYAEGFEAYESAAVPDCWTAIDNGSYGKSRVTTTAASGTKALSVNYGMYSSSGSPSYYQSNIVTPALDVESLKDVLVYFYCRTSSGSNGSLKIEAVSDDTYDAEAITITQLTGLTTNWSIAYVDISQYYTSAQTYNRLRFTPMTQGVSIYIDDIVFTTDKNVLFSVQDVKLQAVTETTAKFSFVEYTQSVSEWQVAYVAAGGEMEDATIITADTTTVTLTGLTANTSYDIYVRGNAEGSEWVGPLAATTIQTPAPLPLITGFDDEADNALWNFYNVQKIEEDGTVYTYPNFWIIGAADSCGAEGTKALYITNDSASYLAYDRNTNMDPVKYSYQGSSITATSSVWTTRNINIAEAGTYMFSFKYKVPKAYSSDGLYVQLIPAGATFKAATATLLSGATRNGSATTKTDNCYAVMSKQVNVEDWTWYDQMLDITEAGIYTLAIYWYNPSSGDPYATPAAIDSVIVEEYPCTDPKDFEFVERKYNGVTLKWFGGKCKDFEYVVSKYKKLGIPNLIDEEDKVAAGTLSDGPQVSISNLLPNTEYALYVRTICPAGYTDWVEHDFLTPCSLEELPYMESFYETPECWILNNGSVGTTSVGTSSDYEEWPRLQLNAGGLAILPELAVDLNKVMVEVGLFNTTTNLASVELGVMDNTWDASTFKHIAYFETVNKPGSTGTYTPSTLEVFSKMMNLYQGSGKVLALKNNSSYSIGVKYVKLTELPDCVQPQQVEVTFVAEKAATVNWLAGVEEAWEILLNDSIIENVTTNPYRVTNLEQGTVYTVAVRAICNAEHTSEWSSSTAFQTPCGVNSLPMVEDFSSFPDCNNSTAKPVSLPCWENRISSTKIETIWNNTGVLNKPLSTLSWSKQWSANPYSWGGDSQQLFFFGSSTAGDQNSRYRWFISPQYAIEGNASLSFDVRCIDNQGTAAHPDGRFFVAVSTDNGATWTQANSTQFELDSVYTKKSLSLDQYAGMNIRIAFYMEDLGGTTTYGHGSGLFTFVDNVRMNCTDTYQVEGEACEGYDYEGQGFVIPAAELPAVGESAEYTRFAINENGGCDSTIVLTLTTYGAEVNTVYESICQGESYAFGLYTLTDPNPVGQPYMLTANSIHGCDSTIYLYLTVTESDTTDMVYEIKENELPYTVDEYCTVPADFGTGIYEQVVKVSGCSYQRYIVTVVEVPSALETLTEEIESVEAYDCTGRLIQTFRNVVRPVVLNAPTGVYMLRYKTVSGAIYTERVVLQ